MHQKKHLIPAVIVGLAAVSLPSHAAVTIGGVDFNGSNTQVALSTANATPIDLDVVGNADWWFFGATNPGVDGATIDVVDERLGGNAFSNLVTTWVDPDTNTNTRYIANGNTSKSIKFSWTNGTAGGGSGTGVATTGFGITGSPLETSGFNSTFTFDVTLQADTDYSMALYDSDQRIGTRVSIWDGLAWQALSSESSNDANNLRTHTIDITGLTADGTYSFKYDIKKTGTTHSFNNMAGISLQSTVAVPEPSSTALIGLGGLALILRRRK